MYQVERCIFSKTIVMACPSRVCLHTAWQVFFEQEQRMVAEAAGGEEPQAGRDVHLKGRSKYWPFCSRTRYGTRLTDTEKSSLDVVVLTSSYDTKAAGVIGRMNERAG